MKGHQDNYGTFVDEDSAHQNHNSNHNNSNDRRVSTSWILSIVMLSALALVAAVVLANNYYHQDFAVFLEEEDDSARPSPPPSNVPTDSSGITAQFDVDAFVSILPSRLKKLVNPNVDPCQDFHEFACGKWEASTEIPDDKASVSFAWSKDMDKTLENLHNILIEDQSSLGTYFRACLNTDLVDKLGLAPLQDLFGLVDSMNSVDDLALLLAEMHKMEASAFFKWKVYPDHSNPLQMQLYLSPGGLGLPNANYYFDETADNTEHKQVYLDMVKTLTLLSGGADPDKVAEDVWALEQEMALATKLKDEHDPNEPLPSWNVTGLAAAFPRFAWDTYFYAWNHLDVASTFNQIVVAKRPWMHVFDQIIGKYTMDVLRSYMRFKIVRHLAPLLPSPFLDALLTYEKHITGKEKLFPRWKKCTFATRGALPFMTSQIYVDKYIPSKTKIISSAMVEDIRLAFKREISHCTWMSNTTRAEALKKVQSMLVETAFPNDWTPYLETNVIITPTSYLQNYIEAMRLKTSREWELLRHNTDRTLWRHIPIIANAYYAAGSNAAWLPVGMLQDPFFNLTMPASYNFGAVGSVMGHEMTHGFDITGRKYDETGMKRMWWDRETLHKYHEHAKCFQDLYDSYVVDGVHVDGARTLGEDIADVGGVKIAYKAWLLAVRLFSPKPPVENDRRLFWMSYASTRCGVTRVAQEITRVRTSVHPPHQFRLIGPVTQLQEFAEDFKCPVGSPMNPADKCVLW